MAAVNSLLFLLTTLAPFTEPPGDGPYDDTSGWHRGLKPATSVLDELNHDTDNFQEWSQENQNSIIHLEDSKSKIFCPPYAVYRRCGTACPKNCSNFEHQICQEHCVADCFCKSPRIKGPDGSCILPSECPPSYISEINTFSNVCKENEVFSIFRSLCPDNCDNYRNPGRSCNYFRLPGCACRKGFLLDKNGDCVRTEECDRKNSLESAVSAINSFPFPEFCNADEKFSLSKPFCPDTCDNFQNVDRACSYIKYPGCWCKEGSVRNRKGMCVKMDQCPEQHAGDCSKNEMFDQCGSYCEEDCINHDSYEAKNCEDKRCRKGCICKPGYVRDSDWQCVVPQDCSSPGESYFKK